MKSYPAYKNISEYQKPPASDIRFLIPGWSSYNKTTEVLLNLENKVLSHVTFDKHKKLWIGLSKAITKDLFIAQTNSHRKFGSNRTLCYDWYAASFRLSSAERSASFGDRLVTSCHRKLDAMRKVEEDIIALDVGFRFVKNAVKFFL